MNYQDWINELSALLPQPLVTGAFNATAPFQDNRYNIVIPRAIEYAELMIYRDPDISLNTMVTGIAMGNTTTPGQGVVVLPTGLTIVDDLYIVVPSPLTPATGGTAITVLPVSLQAIVNFWPQATLTQAPSFNGPGPYWARLGETEIQIAPTPDQAYDLVLYGQTIPVPLAQSATATSYLTLNYPDLFIAASMIYWTAVMKDWGAQTDDPRMALSWDGQYQKEKALAASWENRKRNMGSGWTSLPASPTATSMRGTTGATQNPPGPRP